MKASTKHYRYAPLWISLGSSLVAVGRAVAERALLDRPWKPGAKDLVSAAAGAAVGYALFRFRHGNELPGKATR